MTNLYVICTRILLMRLSMVCPTWHTWGRCWRKEGDMSSESSPTGWYLVPIHSNCYIFSFVVLKMSLEIYIFRNFSDTHISLSHTVHNREIWGICKGVVYACRIVSEVWGLVPIGHVNSPTKPRYWRYRAYH